jgi:23S rRNA (adenine-N6)-dimethyltransferase
VRAGPARRWGWHRLDEGWAARIVAAAAIAPGDLVLDVGAGEGALTQALLAAGARVVAFELHPQRASNLRSRYGDRVRVVVADASDLKLPRRSFSVVANPPFTLSMALLHRLVAPGSRLVAADVVVPRHIAQRWCGGGLSGARRWTEHFDVSIGLRVPGRAFRPSIERDAAVLRLRRLGPPAGRGRPASCLRDPPTS